MDDERRRLGRYRIVRLVGIGGMASVYEARDDSLDRSVAIKVFDTASREPSFVTRIIKESRAQAALHHPNIVTAFDVGMEGSTVFLVMRLLPGGTLDRRIQEGPLRVGDVARILTEVASGIDYAHSVGLIHRDIKPSNILFDESGTAVLSDFGLARMEKHRDRQTEAGFVIGTLAYVSPEVVGGRLPDYRSDLYSFGVVAYEMLTGAPPFGGESAESLLYGQVQLEPPPLRNRRPELPAALEPVLQRALAKEPEKRWATAKEFAQEVTDALGTNDEQAAAWVRGVSPSVQRHSPWRRAGPWLAVAFAGAALTATVFVGPLLVGRMRTFLIAVLAAALVAVVAGVWFWRTRVRVHFGKGADENGNQGNIVEAAEPDGALLDALATRTESATVLFEALPEAPRASLVIEDLSSTRVFPAAGVVGETAEGSLPAVILVITECAERDLVGRSVKVTRVPFTVGRSHEADFSFEDVGVSRTHVTIDFQDGMYRVCDSGSTNGTFVNGRRLPVGGSEPLFFGAQIRLSPSTCLVLNREARRDFPDLTNCIVGQRYRLTRLLRSSQKAVLYAADDNRLPHEVAVKILSPDMAAFPGYMEQFQREARLSAQLQHPYISGVIDFGADSVHVERVGSIEVNYLCMPLLPGGNLADRLRGQEAAVEPRLAATWIHKMAQALDHAHRNGVVHSGLKPTSIVFDAEGNAFLTDFSIAYTQQGPGSTGVVGAPDFLAPEQWENQRVGPAVDQYALAAIAYLLITGSTPYEGQAHPDIRRRNFARGPVAAHLEATANGRPAIPQTVSAILQRALATEPEERYPSVLSFAKSFLDSVHGRVHTGKPRAFVSYQRDQSAGWANLFERELRDKYEIEAFVDTQRRDGAGPFPDRLKRAIDECDVFVCFLARRTLGSKWVREEILQAHQMQKPMIPIFQESYVAEDPAGLETHLQGLLSSDGLRLLDRQNVHVNHTIADLAEIIRRTVRNTAS